MLDWLKQHRVAILHASRHLRQQSLGSVLIILMVGVTLSLPAILFVVVDNVRQLTLRVQETPQLTLFLKLDASAESVAALAEKLKAHPAVKSFHFENKAHAWQWMQQQAGMPEITGSLEKNPLPDAFWVVPRDQTQDALTRLRNEMRNWDAVDLAHIDAQWLSRLDALLYFGNIAVLLLSVLLGFVILAMVANTVRVQLLTQREEIEVSQLIGATRRFIARPFLYLGFFYGLLGGLSAWLILFFVIHLLNHALLRLSAAYGSRFSFSMPSYGLVLAAIGLVVCLSWLTAYVAVTRTLAGLQK